MEDTSKTEKTNSFYMDRGIEIVDLLINPTEYFFVEETQELRALMWNQN